VLKNYEELLERLREWANCRKRQLKSHVRALSRGKI